ncbi:MAG: phosphatase PAP2 family protein [Bacteroidota bacterium]|nr:phosphatase PAP2 family protein [Bacteroidota bacterium]
MKKYFASLDTADFINIVFYALLTIGMAAYSRVIGPWVVFAAVNLAVIACTFAIASSSAGRNRGWSLLRGLFLTLCIPLAFKEVYHLVPAVHPTDYDDVLIAIDHALFGVHPTRWLSRLSTPWLTELLQLSYATFYFLWIALAADLYLKKRMKAYRWVFLTILLGFYLSYIGYASVPAIGPRFTLHDFERIDEELPGIALTPFLRAYTNTGESIPPGTADPARRVQRDCFPSGHTQMTLLVIFLAFRYRSRIRWVLAVDGSLLILATVYLRYHYVVDLAAGAVFAVATWKLTRPLDAWWERRRASLLGA